MHQIYWRKNDIYSEKQQQQQQQLRLVLFLALKIERWNYTVKTIVVILFSFPMKNGEELKAIYYVEPTGKAVRSRELNWINVTFGSQFAPKRTNLITWKTRIKWKTLWSTFLPMNGLNGTFGPTTGCSLDSIEVWFSCIVWMDSFIFICFKALMHRRLCFFHLEIIKQLNSNAIMSSW